MKPIQKELKIIVPFLGVNDSNATLIEWYFLSGQKVSKNEILGMLETTKATIEITSPSDGYFFSNIVVGDIVSNKQVIGYISKDKEFKIKKIIARNQYKDKEFKVTKKADLLIKKYGLKISDFNIDEIKNNKLDVSIIGKKVKELNQYNKRIGTNLLNRIAIIGGVSGGGALIIIDVINSMKNMNAVSVYDRDPKFLGKHILGVPVVGNIDSLKKDREMGLFDKVVIAFNMNLNERDKVFNELLKDSYEFANIIDPSVDIRSNVNIGVGNVILANSYIGPCSKIGNNNFISANVSLEHGNYLGNSCGFGPAVHTSGNVTIEDRVRFCSGIVVEPGVSIGSDSFICSGSVILNDVKNESKILKK